MPRWRKERLNETIKREIEIITKTLKDPGICAMASITKVEVTKDLAYAKVFVSILGSKEEAESTIEAMRRASGYIRHELSTRLEVRRSPALIFLKDDSIEYAVKMSKIIDQVVD